MHTRTHLQCAPIARSSVSIREQTGPETAEDNTVKMPHFTSSACLLHFYQFTFCSRKFNSQMKDSAELLYIPGQKKWAKPKMARYYTFNGLNNKSLVRKFARIKQKPSYATICWFTLAVVNYLGKRQKQGNSLI